MALTYGCHCYGVEYDEQLVIKSRELAQSCGVSHLCHFEHMDILLMRKNWMEETIPRKITHIYSFDRVFTPKVWIQMEALVRSYAKSEGNRLRYVVSTFSDKYWMTPMKNTLKIPIRMCVSGEGKTFYILQLPIKKIYEKNDSKTTVPLKPHVMMKGKGTTDGKTDGEKEKSPSELKDSDPKGAVKTLIDTTTKSLRTKGSKVSKISQTISQSQKKVSLPVQTIGNGVYVSKSTIKDGGLGLFTDHDIRKGEYITKYDGPVIDWKTAVQRRKNGDCSHIRTLVSQYSCIDGFTTPQNGVGGGSFINDATGGANSSHLNEKGTLKNGAFKNTTKFILRTNNKTMESVIWIRAITDIPKNTELFASYGRSYWKNFK